MGFWQTGYLEFHEQTGDGEGQALEKLPVKFPCPTCGVEFASEPDLRVHTFDGHRIQRPALVFNGRECGKSRLTVTHSTTPEDWVIVHADTVTANGRAMSAASATEFLSLQRSGVVDVQLRKSDRIQDFQFVFTLADDDDLAGVDSALHRLIGGGELSLRAIDDFIMRAGAYRSSSRYLAGLAYYLFGVLAREDSIESGLPAEKHEDGGYQGKYDQAVTILGGYDRPPAEAICGIVAFHYNQFERAMTKTKSQRVADVSLRFQALLKREAWLNSDLSKSSHSSLDVALSDSVIEQVLGWSALPLDGSAATDFDEIIASIDWQRPSDAFKMHLVVAEHALAVQDFSTAKMHAERLRHGRLTEGWYAGVRSRISFQGANSSDKP